MIVFNYPSKKALKENIGQPLEYIDNGLLVGANRPHITGKGREFFAQVTMCNGFIDSVK